MRRYRLDPKNPRRDYSDIPPLGDEFFRVATNGDRAMTDDDLYAARLLDIVYRHCKSADGLDSRADRLRAELMRLCDDYGDIEIVDEFGWCVTAHLTPAGLDLLAELSAYELARREQ